ncbi:hypothetical protein Nepgr_024578 [Nepenthes gracilis]|uniref:Uncharacterized protein n=1 Tax=Nepenthes gracilis TaxID=150966 RepID=A0AAD3T4G1_NEPGR|nr:hypothetical protein Nepgr_024578 [Nepenthes gracilis]
MGESWPLPKEWGQVPEVYTGAPSEAEMASLEWLVKLIEKNLKDFWREHLVSRAEAKKANWGPPSPVQKLRIPPPEILEKKKMKNGNIIGPCLTDSSPPSPRRKRAASMAPSSSSSEPDYLSIGHFVGIGVASRVEVEAAIEAHKTKLSGDVVLAQLASSELTQEPPIEAPGPQKPSVGSPIVVILADRVASAMAKALRQRDFTISDRDKEIAWLETKLAASGAEHRDDTATLEAVLASVEAKNLSLKVKVARLKEENE